MIMNLDHEPALPVLTRQDLPTFDRTKYAAASGVANGAYVLADAADGTARRPPDGHGPEFNSASAPTSARRPTGSRRGSISMPSWDIFEHQPHSYKESVIPARRPRQGLRRAGLDLRLGHYTGKTGAGSACTPSALGPAQGPSEQVRLSPEKVVEAAKSQVARGRRLTVPAMVA